jgi:cob(I)alamin adenosyltransferase
MGYIYLYTGTGGGKTTNALGLALRSVGHKKRVVIIQFLKWWKNIGEYKIKDKLKPYYEIYQFGRPAWLKFRLKDGEKKTIFIGGKKFVVESLKEIDKKLAEQALKFAKDITKKRKPHLLVLDEINLALHWKLLDLKEVLEFLDDLPKETNVVLTGRYAPKELIKKAHFVNEIKMIKMPKKFIAQEGIQY